MNKKANIIWLHTDSMDGRIMGCMGNKAVKNATKNLDCLAEKGVLFRNTYSNSPICVPSRASMFSGLFPHHCQAWNNYKGLSESDETVFDAFRRAGYITKIFGKTDYLSGYHTIRARVSAWTRSASILKPNYRMAPPKVIESEERTVHQYDWQTSDYIIKWLEKQGKSSDPFFLYAGFCSPHPEFITSNYYLKRIDEKEIILPSEDKNNHPVLFYQRINKNWTHGFSPETVKLVKRIYYAMIAEIDEMVGEILNAIERFGLKDSTYIIFSSDHGELAMDHQQYYKMSSYEGSVRVPLIVSGPELKKGIAIDNIVSLVDIYPTLIELSGLKPPDKMDGYSLLPELTGATSSHPDCVIAEFHDSSCNSGFFMLRKDNWKYVVYPGFHPHLFDLVSDPEEINNLVDSNPEVAKILDNKLREIIDYEEVDKIVKEYDRESFSRWRNEHLAKGDYRELMGRIFSGWDYLAEKEGNPWTDSDEQLIIEWLKK